MTISTPDTNRLEWARADNIVQGFLPWVPWIERHKIPVPNHHQSAHEYPGVYLFLESEHSPANVTDYRDRRIIYVGESDNLGSRWRAYQRWIPDVWCMPLNRIWVAAFPTWLGHDPESPHPLTVQFRLYTERRIIWELFQLGVALRNTR